MTADPKIRRVALLARAGLARERLATVVDEAGVHCVLAADPTQLDPADLLEAEPQVLLVALDAATEEVLERFDAVLGDPSIDVIFEEAENIARREGWDAARWQRHLVAKLQGHADVLPPSVGPAPVTDAGTADIATAVVAPSSYAAFDPLNAEMDASYFGTRAESSLLPPLTDGQDAWVAPIELDNPYGDLGAQDDGLLPDDADDGRDLDFSLAQFLPEGASASQVADGELEIFDPMMADEPDALAAAGDEPGRPAVGFASSGLTLLDDVEGAYVPDSTQLADSFQHDLAEINERIAGLELLDDTPRRGPEHARGAVLVLSGIGGPDAVRQLLGALPGGFARPVLVQQRLDGGRYDKLVVQLQRATTLPVKLAEPGQLALAGMVFILPDTVGLRAGDFGMRFSNDPGDDVLAALPPPDSAVLLLSGSDPAQVDAAMTHKWAGALVAGQAADGCYDPTAPDALAARGGDVAPPAELAQTLCKRWPTRGTQDVQI